jgi:hypothetical protein
MTRTEYVRKSFSVVAEEVNFENVHEVAAWCKGTVVMETTKLMGTETKLPVIVLKGQGDNRGKEFKATLGCFVVELKGSFRVYKNAQFFSSFEEAVPLSLVEATDALERENHSMVKDLTVTPETKAEWAEDEPLTFPADPDAF